jgi:glucokinase
VTTIGIDLGGTKIYGARVDAERGEIAAEAKAKTPVQGGPLAVVDTIVKVVADLDGAAGTIPVGVGAPGVVDVERGIVRAAPNLPGWIEPFGLGDALADALSGAKVVVDNDVNVGTLAEHRLGAGKGAGNLLGVFVGTGVGGGLVLDGALRRGPSGMAGEIGHVVVKHNGRVCGCGGRGHLEAYAGRAGMERRARELEAKGHDTVLTDLAKAKRMTSSVWAKALAAGDRVAIELIDEGVAALGQAIASAVTLLDIDLVVLGGGLADRLGSSYVTRVRQAVRAQVFAGRQVDVVAAELGDAAGAMGAALLAAAAAA